MKNIFNRINLFKIKNRYQIKLNRQMNKLAKSIISEYETTDIKFVWGILSMDDFSNHANLFTMNDFEIDYLKDEKKYLMSIETIYAFKNKHAKYNYLKDLLNKFTNYMIINDREIKEPCLYDVFTEGLPMDFKYDTIEECYMAFKILVNGFCSYEETN